MNRSFVSRHAAVQTVFCGGMLLVVLWSGCGSKGSSTAATGSPPPGSAGSAGASGSTGSGPTGGTSAGAGGDVGAGGDMAAGAGGGGASGTGGGATFRAVFLADTHVIGPQYACCTENSPADNSSIVKTVERLSRVRDIVAGIKPAPALAFVLGDIVHDAYHSHDRQWYRDNPNAFSIARDILASFPIPVHVLLGNHDYGVDCSKVDDYERAFTHGLFQEFFSAPPYESVDFGGFKFLLTNGQLGDTWDSASTRCTTDAASLGTEQMQWAAAQLDEGKPTLVMSHYMRLLFDEKEQGAFSSFPALLDSRSNVKGFLAGHTHRWLDLSALNKKVPHHVIGATRYDSDNFWVIEFDGAAGTIRILDEAKARPGNSCADTWSYDGDPAVVPDAPETGDCVSGQ